MIAENFALWHKVVIVLTDPLFLPVLAVVTGIVALGSLYYGRRGPSRKEPRKELSFGLISRAVLLSSSESIANDLSVVYKGKAIAGKLTAITVSIMSTGQLPIVISDFDGPLKIKINDIQHMFSAVLLRSSPAHLMPEVTNSGNLVTVNALLLNPGDFVALRLIVENKERVTAMLESRVVGVTSHPTLRLGRHPGYDNWGLFFWGAFSVSVLAANAFLWAFPTGWMARLMGLVFPVMGVSALYGTVMDRMKIKRTRWMGDDTKDLDSST